MRLAVAKGEAVNGDALLLAVDGGQTATKALLARIDGTVLVTGQGGPSDHFHIEGGVERNRQAIQGAIDSALAAAGAAPQRVVSIALGLTGALTAGTENPHPERIVREVLAPDHVTVVPDIVTNLAGASGGEPGIVVIAGGGAIAYGVTADGREGLSGGFGYLLGDEGSAFDIGRRAITAATRASDGRDPPTALEAIVRDAFGLTTTREVTAVVYRAGFSRQRIALLAPEVAAAAQAGDGTARRIMTTAGKDLAGAALAVICQIRAPGDAADVYPTGGVFRAGDLVMTPFRDTLLAGWPTATVRTPRFPPVVGALILARRACGLAADAAWLARVAETMPA
jgi:glucosamine kinase